MVLLDLVHPEILKNMVGFVVLDNVSDLVECISYYISVSFRTVHPSSNVDSFV